MIYFEKKNASNALAFTRLFGAETAHFSQIHVDSAQFTRNVVEIPSFTGSKLRQFRLISSKLGSCAVQFPLGSRP